MTTTSRRTVRRQLRLAVAGAVMLTALTTGTAAATSSTARAGASPKPQSDPALIRPCSSWI
jgi:Spy/CpxP family protein refolding chaperone